MWLHIPEECMSSACAQESDRLTLDLDLLCQSLALCASWKGKSMQAKSWRGVCKMVYSTARRSMRTLPPSMASRGVESWIASLPVFHVNPVQQQGSAEELKTSAGYGRTSQELFARFNPDGYFSKMYRDSYLPTMAPPLSRCSGTWPKAGSMRNGVVSQPRKSERRIDGSGCLSWPTPNARVSNDGEGVETYFARREALKAAHQNGNGAGLPLSIAAQLWPTPMAQDAEQAGSAQAKILTLTQISTNWPTPKVTRGTYTRDQGDPTKQRPTLRGLACSHQDQATTNDGQKSCESIQTSRPRLNPRFVEFLMGWPLGWTEIGAPADKIDFASWETAACRLLSRLLLSRFGEDCRVGIEEQAR